MCIPEFIGKGGCAALKAGDANMYVPPTCHGCGMGAMTGCGFAVGDVREPGPEVAAEHRFEFLKPVVSPRSCYKCAEILTYEDGCKVRRDGERDGLLRGLRSYSLSSVLWCEGRFSSAAAAFYSLKCSTHLNIIGNS